MPDRKTTPPLAGDRPSRPSDSGERRSSDSGERPSRPSDTGKSPKRPKAEQYELKVRWETARQVLEVSPTGVRFDFNSPLKVATRYPVSLKAPGVAFSTTVEVTRCQLTVDPTSGRFFRVTAKFFPYVE